MAASFVAASSQVLENAAPAITVDYPMSVGAWVFGTTVAQRQIWCLSDTATTNNYHRFGLTASHTVELATAAGGAVAAAATTATITGTWVFCIARLINATNRRVSALNSNGAALHAQNTTSRSPTGFDTMTIGALKISGTTTNYMNGSIGEWWITDTDIQADGAQLQDSLLRQLAYGGPFSVPHIAKDIIEYRSFRKHPTASEIGEVYWGKSGVQNWTNTNGVTIGPHVPLSAWYNRPPQTQIIRPSQNLLRSGIWSQAAPVAEVTMFDGFYPSMVDRNIKIIPY